MRQKEHIIVGISSIRSARRWYIEEFWKIFFKELNLDYLFSKMSVIDSYEKGKKFYGNSNAFCMFRYMDVGQHVDLIEKGCNCLILLSQREDNKRACSTENYVSEHLAVRYPHVKIINFFIHINDRKKQIEEIYKLCKHFTSDENIINRIVDCWPNDIKDENQYKDRKPNAINLLVLGDMYYFLNPRMKDSLYIEYLRNVLNCNIITPTDFEEKSLALYKRSYIKAKELIPVIDGNFEHYWRTIKRLHIIDVLITNRNEIDGVLIVSDIWCEMFKEEAPAIIKLIETLEIPFYNLLFNIDSLSTIETILESFVETIVDRRRKT